MPSLAFYNNTPQPVCDFIGILIAETKLCGIINNCSRRQPMPYTPIDLYKDNDRRLRVFIKDGNLNVVDVTNAVGIFTVKDTKADAIIFQKSTAVPGEGAIGSGDEGEMFFYIVPSDTASLTGGGQYVYDVQVTLDTGLVYTTVEGVINLLQPVNP